MANFNRKPRFNNDRPDMHKATCASCGQVCEVPFRPTGSKPVYCKECFRKNEGSDSRRSGNRSFGRSDSGDRQMHDAVCANCGNSCQIPFRPSPGRDVFCSRCFEDKDSAGSQRPKPGNFDKQFEILNAKMDKILSILTPAVVEVAPLDSAIDEKVIEEIAQEVAEDKVVAIKKEKVEAKSPAPKKASKTKKSAS